MVHAMDDGIGTVLQTLERLHLRENTLVFFLSDNGGPENSNGSCNDPLRGQKGQVYDGGIRVPFLVSWPGVLPAGAVYEQPVISLDITRTALAVSGAEPESHTLDGVNLLPDFLGQAEGAPHEALFWRQASGEIWAARAGDYKLLRAERDVEAAQLYQLAEDIGESQDRAGDEPDRVQAIRQQYERWNRGNQPPFFPSFRTYWPHMDQVYRDISGASQEP
jgi:arylsulfatase A-like enzyme